MLTFLPNLGQNMALVSNDVLNVLKVTSDKDFGSYFIFSKFVQLLFKSNRVQLTGLIH